MAINPQKISLQVAEKLREIATRQGRVPFDKGDLRKAHVVEPYGAQGAKLAAKTPYARAVHDGRPKLIIKPRKGKALYWKGAAHPVKRVVQPARRGRPWLRESVEDLRREGLDFLKPTLGPMAVRELEQQLRRSGFNVTRR